MAPTDLAELVEAARAGDRGAVENLYLALRDWLLPRLERRLPPTLDPEDLLDETFLAVWVGLNRLRAPETFLAYADQTAHYLANGCLRRLHRYCPITGDLDLARPDPAAGNLEAEERLLALFKGLSCRDRKLFRLLYVLGQTGAQVELELHVTRGHFWILKHRLRAKVRRMLTRLSTQLG